MYEVDEGGIVNGDEESDSYVTIEELLKYITSKINSEKGFFEIHYNIHHNDEIVLGKNIEEPDISYLYLGGNRIFISEEDKLKCIEKDIMWTLNLYKEDNNEYYEINGSSLKRCLISTVNWLKSCEEIK